VAADEADRPGFDLPVCVARVMGAVVGALLGMVRA
jgi:hypothetical protein